MTLDGHHVVGKSQNFPESIPLFLQKNAGDPAIKVAIPHPAFELSSSDSYYLPQDFVPKLKTHLLPRLKEILQQESLAVNAYSSGHRNEHSNQSRSIPGVAGDARSQDDTNADAIFFKNDRMYRHNLIRLNYTTYDIRRSQDVVNPKSSHQNIMLLANKDDSNTDTDGDHPFLYARVLGIYHINVIYTGFDTRDYMPRRLDFLWVRWFRLTEDKNLAHTWRNCQLDMIHFPPVASLDAFGFVDPRDILRGCHVVPSFARGLVHSDGRGISYCAEDVKDYRRYYAMRYDPHSSVHHFINHLLSLLDLLTATC